MFTLSNEIQTMKGNSQVLNNQKKNPLAFPAGKPFLKWAGGKGQLLEKFNEFYPEELEAGVIQHYYEPFVGGGAVFFDLAGRYNFRSATLCDINEELILTYRVVQQDVSKLLENLDLFQKKYRALDEKQQHDFFYEVRSRFNSVKTGFSFSRYSERWIERAAQIIFLNRTCFNGLFRFNSRGEFNVPAGKYKNPQIVNAEVLLKASQLLQIAEIRNAGFETIETDIKNHSFVYFDPPYRPISITSGFTSYSKEKFTDAEQTRLAALFHRLDKCGAKLMLSNSDPKNTNPDDNFFDQLYNNYQIFRIPAKRMINSNAAKRHAINEIIVTNYNNGKEVGESGISLQKETTSQN
jgi:DNA adenine methylase